MKQAIEKPNLKNTYTIGQVVEFRSGAKGEVISVCTFGNGDIRPPYNRYGLPEIKMLSPHIGYTSIIPNDWNNYYNETFENELISL